MIKYEYQCLVFDGSRVRKVERCANERDAKERAAKWRAVGHKSEAYIVEINTRIGEMWHYPL
jgi:hypothetical protein